MKLPTVGVAGAGLGLRSSAFVLSSGVAPAGAPSGGHAWPGACTATPNASPGDARPRHGHAWPMSVVSAVRQ
jgi:hypothetical protein